MQRYLTVTPGIKTELKDQIQQNLNLSIPKIELLN
jgi:hypothetical protein